MNGTPADINTNTETSSTFGNHSADSAVGYSARRNILSQKNVRKRKLGVANFLAWASLAVAGIAMPLVGSAEVFPVYDLVTTGTQNQVVGFEKIQFANDAELLADEPVEADVKRVARRLSRQYYTVIDIEHWAVHLHDGTPEAEVNRNIQRLVQVVKWMRQENPYLRLGFYGLFPVNEYWMIANYLDSLQHVGHPWWDSQRAIFKAAYDKWHARNIALAGVAEYVDAIFPSLYAFYDRNSEDRAQWRRVASAILTEAKMYKKPVIPFVWPKFHNSAVLANQWIPADFWSEQLSLLHDNANGLTIWDDNSTPITDSLPWWQETRRLVGQWRAVVQPSSRFTISSRVATTADAVDVNSSPSNATTLLGRVPPNLEGTVFNGPVAYAGSNWWRISFDNGLFGWSKESSLTIPSAGLVGRWQFAEGGGDVVLDNSGKGNSGTIVNGASRTVDTIGSALDFDGGDYVSIPSSKSLNFGSGNFSLASWVNLRSGASEQAFIAKNVVGVCCAPDGYPGYFIGYWHGRIVLRVEDTAAGINRIDVGVSAAPYFNRLTHVAGVRSGNNLTLYINGASVASATLPNREYSVDNDRPLALGSASVFGAQYYPLVGRLAGVHVYNRALTTGELADLVQVVATAVPNAAAPGPGGLTVYPVSSTEISVAWQPVGSGFNAVGYRVYRNGAYVTTTFNPSFVDVGLTPGTAYTYKVAAFDVNATSSPFSASVTGITAKALATQLTRSSVLAARIQKLSL